MGIIKKIIAIILCICIFGGVLYLGGYTFSSWADAIELKNPMDIFGPYLPDMGGDSNNSTDNSENNNDENNSDNNSENNNDNNNSTNGGWFPDDLEFENNGDDLFNWNQSKEIIVNIGKKAYTVTKDNVVKFIQWLQQNTSDNSGNNSENNSNNSENNNSENVFIKVGSKIYKVAKDSVIKFIQWLQQNLSGDETVEIIDEDAYNDLLESENNNDNNEEENENNYSPEEAIVVYNNILQNAEDLKALLNSITIVDELPNLTDYDRTTFESPTHSYKLDGKTVNRNDYAWKTSKWFNEDNFTYTCPYTGKVIYDLDDNKEDNDFGNLDYDHICPLKSVYIRGGNKWTAEQQNEYAYNQWVGVDVLNSANRSKGDKGPAEWLPTINIEDYCYSWIMICSYYDLVMTQEEIDICTEYIAIALSIGEPVEFLGGYYEN